MNFKILLHKCWLTYICSTLPSLKEWSNHISGAFRNGLSRHRKVLITYMVVSSIAIWYQIRLLTAYVHAQASQLANANERERVGGKRAKLEKQFVKPAVAPLLPFPSQRRPFCNATQWLPSFPVHGGAGSVVYIEYVLGSASWVSGRERRRL